MVDRSRVDLPDVPEISLLLDDSSSNDRVCELQCFLFGLKTCSICELFVHALNLRDCWWTGQAGMAGSTQYAVEKDATHWPEECLMPKKTLSPVSSSRTS